jgi:hypothetical protein
MISRPRAYTLRDEATDFARRCESALTVARQTGAADWKIAGLEEALADALEAKADWNRLLG